MQKILITGAAGFIGYHLSRSLLEDGNIVFGVDNLNNYYDTDLKEQRLKRLKSFRNFTFKKIDLIDEKKLNNAFLNFNPSIVIHLAAQAGVRYSIENPRAYLDSNLIGFHNIVEQCRRCKIEKLIYASSSSIYGLNEKIPFSVNDKTDYPVSLYGATKKSNELVAHAYSHLYGLKTIGLRFFTVYGPWGRPDMAYFSFTKKIIEGRKIEVFNHGNMQRDFTYIDDIVDGIRNTIEKDFNFEIFNLGNSKSENLMTMIRIIEKELNIKANIVFKDMQAGDVFKTYADIKKSSKMLEFKPKVSLQIGLKRTIDWYKSFIGLK
ncbi:MAG: NAD-dependent epimerase/dehydratase family protein [bacterium TMED144]|nr:MAG: NAD-dependent epimerase/dehydratase family protein [bacterium TMED144]